MKDKYTHISVVIDRSGSMSSMATDVIGGFNTLLEDQLKVDGEATMTVVRFDNVYEVISDFVPLKDVAQLNNKNFIPRGNTALLDAMGRTMNDVRAKINALPEDQKPHKAIFVFITDGEENASTEYNKDRVFEMISDLRSPEENEIHWEFVFIGANQDAIQAGNSLGISRNASLSYAASGAGAKAAFCSLSSGLTSYRCCSDTDYSFTENDRKQQEELDKDDTDQKFNKSIPDYLSDSSKK